MKRFIVISNDMIVSERFDSLDRIVGGEIEANETHGKVGQVLVNGVWINEVDYVEADEINLLLLQAEGVI